MAATEREIEGAAAALFCYGQPATVDRERAWAMLLEQSKPPYRDQARLALEAAAHVNHHRSGED